MNRLFRHVLRKTKGLSDKVNMWIIFGAMCSNVAIMSIALFIAAPSFSNSVPFFLVVSGLILILGLMVWRQLFQNIIAIGHVSMGIKQDLEVAIAVIEKEKAEVIEQKKAVRSMTMKAGLANELQSQVKEELVYLKEFAGQTKTSLFKMADSIDIELQENIQNITLQSEKANEIAAKLTESAQTVGDKSDTVASGAAQALNNTTNVQKSAEGLNEAVNEITKQMEQTTKLTQKAVSISNETQQTISGLEDAAKGIEDIIELINNIAHQTNLLALNATIEAARAGDAGRGFAVVASEVKALACQTTQSIEKITNHIKGIQSKVGNAVNDIDQIKKSIDDVQASADIIRKEVFRQGESTQEITSSVAEARASVQTVTDGVHDISSEASSNVAIVGEINVISEELAIQVLSIRNHMLEIVQTALDENERRSTERFQSTVKSVISLQGSKDIIPVQILDYSMGGAQIKLLEPVALEKHQTGTISTSDDDTMIKFNVCDVNGDLVNLQFNDEEELVRMLNLFLNGQAPANDEEDLMEDVELFG